MNPRKKTAPRHLPETADSVRYAEGKILDFLPPAAVDTGCLRTFPHRGHPQKILCTTREFSAVCPFSGLPDVATVEIEYFPGGRCIELKSLKYYFVSFRNVGIFQEAATDRIFSDLRAALRPRYLRVSTVYNTRGGIDTTCQIEGGRRPAPAGV